MEIEPPMELLAPVNAETLDTALEAGADAVYFGLKKLNARRGAKNFTQLQLPSVVRKIHDAGAKAHLTINIDLSTREVALAARMLQCAEEAGVDAVIVRDPAILSMRQFFPRLQFHLSTQCGISSEAGVRAAKFLGADRVVLARELTRDEIAECRQVSGVELEVFVQGAMCFSCSGRCLMSSWVGGRSGNRGACASPCRVAWKQGETAGNPLSMHDLCLLGELETLKKIGISSLKIEGRLKSRDWVKTAVGLYRRTLDSIGETRPEQLQAEASSLGDYTGRQITTGYFNHLFAGLTESDGGRIRSAQRFGGAHSSCGDGATEESPESPVFQIALSNDDTDGTCVAFDYRGATDHLRIPPQRIASPKRAVPLQEMVKQAVAQLPAECRVDIRWAPGELSQRLLPRRLAGDIEDAVAQFYRNSTREDDGIIRLNLKAEVVRSLTESAHRPVCTANRLHLGDLPDTLRFNAGQLVGESRLAEVVQKTGHERLIIQWDGTEHIAGLLERLKGIYPHRQMLLALPQVLYHDQIAGMTALLRQCRRMELACEVNSWDTLALVKECGVPFECGCGLAVINPRAAEFLVAQGARAVMISPEIDQEKLEELCKGAHDPLSLTVFSYPSLMQTRAELPSPFDHGIFCDGRKTLVRAMAEGPVTHLRSMVPFDWRRLNNPAVTVAHIVADFAGSTDLERDASPWKDAFKFNYDRELK